MAQIVSITLQTIDDARPVINAIRADNPGISEMAMPGAIKFNSTNPLIIKRDTVSENMGRDWDPQEIHLVLISMAGNLDEDDDRIELSWTR